RQAPWLRERASRHSRSAVDGRGMRAMGWLSRAPRRSTAPPLAARLAWRESRRASRLPRSHSSVLRPHARGAIGVPIVDKNGVPIFVSRKWGTERACAECGGSYTVTNITGRQLYCSEQCRERAQWKRESRRPEVVAANRERCRRWATENRSV